MLLRYQFIETNNTFWNTKRGNIKISPIKSKTIFFQKNANSIIYDMSLTMDGTKALELQRNKQEKWHPSKHDKYTLEYIFIV